MRPLANHDGQRQASRLAQRVAGAALVAVLVAAVAPARAPFGSASSEAFAADRILAVTTDFSTGSVAVVENAPPWNSQPDLAPVCADAVARVHEGLVYVVNRFGCDNIEILDPASGWSIVREFSVGSGSNPQDIALVSPSRAYVSRYETNLLLEVNPATGAHLGTIDLSPLADAADGLCEMHRMQVWGGHLFVQVQRMDRRNIPWVPVPPSQLAVVDLTARTLVDVDPSAPGVQGIVLEGTNPVAPMQIDLATGDLLVPLAGEYGVIDDGGIERVDPASWVSRGRIVTEAALGGDIVDFAQWNSGRAYAVVAEPGFETVLASFDPTTGERTGTVYDPGGYSLSDCLVHPSGWLYLSDRDFFDPGIRVFHASTGTPAGGPVFTGLPPFELLVLPDATSGVADGAPILPGLPAPNPSTGRVLLSWSAQRLDGPVRLEVFDATGRSLRSIRVEAAAGPGAVRWDGRDDRGGAVPAGAYWLRLSCAASTAPARSVRILR